MIISFPFPLYFMTNNTKGNKLAVPNTTNKTRRLIQRNEDNVKTAFLIGGRVANKIAHTNANMKLNTKL